MRWFLILVATFSFSIASEAFADVDLGAEGDGFDIELSVHLDEKLGGWAVWKRYHMSEEWVMARPVDAAGDSAGEVIDVAGGAGIFDGVSLAASDDGENVWVFWSRYEDARWRVEGRIWNQDGGWGEVEIVSAGEGHALKPRAVVMNDGTVVLAWHDLGEGAGAKVMTRLFGNKEWQKIAVASDGDRAAFRPVPVGHGNEVWLLWDVDGASPRMVQLLPEMGRVRSVETSSTVVGENPIVSGNGPRPVEVNKFKIHPATSRELHGEPAVSTNEGICVPVLQLVDVIAAESGRLPDSVDATVLTADDGGEGVIDMTHLADVIRLPVGEGKQTFENTWSGPAGDSRATDPILMLSGLLPDLRPSKGYPSGYSGRRRHPIMIDGEGDDGGAWMIWERKSKPAGSGTRTAGQLLGRQIVDGVWGETVLLMDGLIDYRAALPAKVREGKMWVVGAKLQHHWRRPSQLVAIDVSAAQPFDQEDWSDQFKPLAIEMENVEQREKMRYSVVGAGEKKMKLYWGDLHCHSGLTGDAEGEPDEILYYARDRAGLDVMVLQDNDDVHGRPLTEGEYYMGVAHSQWATQPGEFVALPGYEWTQRTSDNGVPEPSISGFEQTIAKGYPNHRTVIYPHAGGPIVRYFEVEQDFTKMADAVYAAGGILNSQHPAFKITDHSAEANLEVTACWGVYIRSVPQRFHAELNKGRHTGFVGTSDSHRRNPGLCGGLTGIWAEELTSEAILDALKAHRCFATNGSRIVVDSRAAGEMPDSVVTAEGDSIELSLSVRATKPITRVVLTGDGGTIEVFEGDGSTEMQLTRKMENLTPGRHWFYWEVEQEGDSKQYSGNISKARGHRAWSSPHFVDVK